MPTVFISSTNGDLADCRRAALEAANTAGFHADWQEDWTAEDCPPLDACLDRVRKADVLVVIVAHRYGSAPADAAGNPDGKSYTCSPRSRTGWTIGCGPATVSCSPAAPTA